MDAQKLFGQRIKELRKQNNLTQEQVSEFLGVFQKQVGNIETGTTFTTMANLEKLACIFGVEIKDLFDFNHRKTRPELVKEISQILDNASENDLKLIYRLVKDVVR